MKDKKAYKHLHIQVLDTITNAHKEDPEAVLSYNINYARNVEGVPQVGLKPEDVLDSILSNMANVLGIHVVTATTNPTDAVAVLGRLIEVARKAVTSSLVNKYGKDAPPVPQPPPALGDEVQKLVKALESGAVKPTGEA